MAMRCGEDDASFFVAQHTQPRHSSTMGWLGIQFSKPKAFIYLRKVGRDGVPTPGVQCDSRKDHTCHVRDAVVFFAFELRWFDNRPSGHRCTVAENPRRFVVQMLRHLFIGVQVPANVLETLEVRRRTRRFAASVHCVRRPVRRCLAHPLEHWCTRNFRLRGGA